MKEFEIIKKLKIELESLSPLENSRKEKLEKKMRLEFNYNTNHIEGNTLTYSDTELLLIFDDTQGNHTLRELEEMKGSDVAFQLIIDLAADKERPLTEQYIKYLNSILLVRPFWKDAITDSGQQTRRLIKVGDYKEFPNSVRLQNGEIFHYASPIDTPILMKELLEWFRDEEKKDEFNIIELAALLHYKFVRIHPFDDGNGRISRLLLNYVLLKNNFPPVIIKTDDKKNYLQSLNKADIGDVDSFVQYIAKQVIWSFEISIKAAKGEPIDEIGDLSKKIKILKQKLQIGSDKITIKKNKSALLSVFENSLVPLYKNISETLLEIDGLFKSSNEFLSLKNKTPLANNLTNSLNSIRTSLSNNVLFSLITYEHSFNNFRNNEIQHNFVLNFKVEFLDHVYEIILDNTVLKSKLYSEFLTEIEINDLTEKIGLKIFNEIEQSIN